MSEMSGGSFPAPEPETLVGCGCATVWHRIVVRLNAVTGRATETRCCGECGGARVLRAEIEITPELRAQLEAMDEPDEPDGPDGDACPECGSYWDCDCEEE